eukprot:7806337-Lingulodinium_polyedra.AAC.1
MERCPSQYAHYVRNNRTRLGLGRSRAKLCLMIGRVEFGDLGGAVFVAIDCVCAVSSDDVGVG